MGEDIERAQAELRLMAMAERLKGVGVPLGVQMPCVLEDIKRLSDDQLRQALMRARLELSAGSDDRTAAQKRVLAALRDRLRADDKLLERVLGSAGVQNGEFESDHDLEALLSDSLALCVGADGLIEVSKVTPHIGDLIGALPLAMFHYSASGQDGQLQLAIEQEGLRVGRQTNFFNTQAGVYLSTLSNSPVNMRYAKRATMVHGGDQLVWRVGVCLEELEPDPDDLDLPWAFGVQFVAQGVEPWRISSAEICGGARFERWLDDCLSRCSQGAAASRDRQR